MNFANLFYFFFLSSIEEEMEYNLTYSTLKIQQIKDISDLVKHYLFALEIFLIVTAEVQPWEKEEKLNCKDEFWSLPQNKLMLAF